MPGKILAIDDDKEFANLIVTLLGNRGYQVRSANSGAEGLEILTDFSPDLILQDYMLPDVNGLNLLSRLKEKSPASQIIIMTAKGNEEVAVEIIKAGAADYLKKPFETAKLLTTVENVLKLQKSIAALERVKEELARQNQELNAVNTLSSAFTSNLPISEKYNFAVEIVLKSLKADLANLFLYDESKSLRLLASSGLDINVYPGDTPSRRGFNFHVSEVRKPVVVANFEEEKRFQVPGDIIERGLKSAIGMPVMYKNSLKGVLSIYSIEERIFSSFEMKLVGVLANILAVMMEKDHLARVLGDFQRQWQVTFDAIPEKVILQDLEHRVIMANRAAAEGSGLEVTDLIGQVCCWVLHSSKEPVEGCPVEDVKKTMKPVRREIDLRGSGHMEVSAYPVFDEEGNLLMVAEHLKKVQ